MNDLDTITKQKYIKESPLYTNFDLLGQTVRPHRMYCAPLEEAEEE